MSERLHVHVPVAQLISALPLLLERRLQPEVAFKGPDLDMLSPQHLRDAGSRLAGAGLKVTIHAPFADLNPGALEPLVFEATRRRFFQTLEAADRLGARLVVFHPGYEWWKYGGLDHLWLNQNLRFWPPLLKKAAEQNCTMALENIFEKDTGTLSDLLSALDTPWLGHCFDIGHWNLFSEVSLADWFDVLGSRLVHLHLHDNRGKADDHLPVGEGNIDFDALFRLIPGLPAKPTMTLEAHTRANLLRSLAGVAPFLAG
jgi:sugar phosphate isomerase/epimerase